MGVAWNGFGLGLFCGVGLRFVSGLGLLIVLDTKVGIVFYYVLYVLWCGYVGLDFVLLFLCCFIWLMCIVWVYVLVCEWIAVLVCFDSACFDCVACIGGCGN